MKSTRYYNEELDLHVYFDHKDNKYHLQIGDKKIIITEALGTSFEVFGNIVKKKICPKCLQELNEEDFTGKLEKK
jgi:hypothetical protein